MENTNKDASRRQETKFANGITYVFEYLEDGWIAISEYNDGLPLKPLIQACNDDKAMEYITMREKLSFPIQRLA